MFAPPIKAVRAKVGSQATPGADLSNQPLLRRLRQEAERLLGALLPTAKNKRLAPRGWLARRLCQEPHGISAIRRLASAPGECRRLVRPKKIFNFSKRSRTESPEIRDTPAHPGNK